MTALTPINENLVTFTPPSSLHPAEASIASEKASTKMREARDIYVGINITTHASHSSALG